MLPNRSLIKPRMAISRSDGFVVDACVMTTGLFTADLVVTASLIIFSLIVCAVAGRWLLVAGCWLLE